ncbi:MAG: glycoside hydrolase family 57 protein, partial [Planctomycetales bacterium]
DPVESALPRFTERDIRDLQVWSNLTWFHPLAFHEDDELSAFREKGKNWTEKEKLWLLDKQRKILGRVIPLHRELAETGQIELTTTPFYHPILPLLWDKRSAREAMPGCELPKHLESYAEDARTQIRRAVAYHEELFGAPPVGLWPSEGSVSQAIVGAIAEANIKWIATDEEILSHSTDGWVSRDGHGHMRHPEMLFRPWKAAEGDRSLAIVFRDHALSDLIGFHYQRSDPNHAANDMLDRLEGIGRAVQPASGGRPALVPVILDGENCWEYYPDGGVQFLRSLYRGAVQRPHIRPVRVRDFLDEHPPTDRIGRLFAGSWIAHDFAIWIGHQEDRAAWDLLHETREFLKKREATGKVPAKALEQAWEELFIAEGSDWFWWYGDDHNSALDALFDQLFRKHLENVYALLDAPVPPVLRQPISRTEHRVIHSQPTGLSHVKVDGRHSYFEWINAGRYEAGSERGTMTKVTEGLIRAVWMGFDSRRLYLRIDTAGGAAEALRAVDELRIEFLQPDGIELRVTGIPDGTPQARLWRGGKEASSADVSAAVGTIVEASVSLAD